jgi:tripartite-type tricarboxylate transporter receptor subunit TctC
MGEHMNLKQRTLGRRIPVLFAALALTVAACGGDTAAPAPAPAAPAPAPEAPAPDPNAPPENVLRGKTIEFVVPFNPGGGYDTYARLLAPELERVLEATVTVSNIPGAGGLVALNQTWTGRTDGTLIQIVEGASALLAELAGQDEVLFRAAEFEWLSGVLGEPTVITTSADGPIKDLPSLIAAGAANGAIRLTSTGVMNSHSVAGLVFERALGVPVQIIGGFNGTDDAFAAVLRGEADGLLASVGTGTRYARAGEGTIIVSLSKERSLFSPDIPALGEQNVAADAQPLVQMQSDIADITRAIVAPPGTDAAAVAVLRWAFEQVLTNEQFLADALSQGRDLEWRSGEEITRMVEAALLATPPAYLALIEETFERAAG